MKSMEMKWAPALVAVAVVGGSCLLATQDHAQIAAAMAVIGLVVQAFLPAAVAKKTDGAS